VSDGARPLGAGGRALGGSDEEAAPEGAASWIRMGRPRRRQSHGGGLELDALRGPDVPLDGAADDDLVGDDAALHRGPDAENHDAAPPHGSLEPSIDAERAVGLDVARDAEVRVEDRVAVADGERCGRLALSKESHDPILGLVRG
jgi:hypothetical protein